MVKRDLIDLAECVSNIRRDVSFALSHIANSNYGEARHCLESIVDDLSTLQSDLMYLDEDCEEE